MSLAVVDNVSKCARTSHAWLAIVFISTYTGQLALVMLFLRSVSYALMVSTYLCHDPLIFPSASEKPGKSYTVLCKLAVNEIIHKRVKSDIFASPRKAYLAFELGRSRHEFW